MINYLEKRQPDIKIGENYLWRWHLIPRNRFLNVYLHQFHTSDDDRALHDHPWWSLSILFKGEMKEHHLNGTRLINKWLPVIRSARFAHRLEVINPPVSTIFITGPRIRDWGFHCPNNWRTWQQFTDTTGLKIGKGCD